MPILSNAEIKEFVFDDSRVDSLKDFDCVARSALINRAINVEEYLEIERIRKHVFDSMKSLSHSGQVILRDILLGA